MWAFEPSALGFAGQRRAGSHRSRVLRYSCSDHAQGSEIMVLAPATERPRRVRAGHVVRLASGSSCGCASSASYETSFHPAAVILVASSRHLLRAELETH